MNLKIIIGALRIGQELPRTTGVQWAGIAFTVVSLALTALAGVALSQGWIQTDIPPEQIYELSSLLVRTALLVIGYAQVATSTRVGLPADRRVRAPEPDGMPDQSMPTGADTSSNRDPGPLPGGPFFGGD